MSDRMARILVIDDEDDILYTMERFLSHEGYEVDTVKSYNEAKERLVRGDFDLIFLDIILEDGSGMDILNEVRKMGITCPVILITGYPDIETASDAVRLKAYDYIFKPFKKMDIIHVVKMALQHKELIDNNVRYQSNIAAIFRSVKDAIVTVDEELCVIESNHAAGDICGFYMNDVRGRSLKTLITGCSEKCLDAIVETINTRQPVEQRRFECRRKDMPRRVVSVSTFPLLDHHEKSYGCVMVAKDETRLVDLERDLEERRQFHKIVGKSEKMQKIYSMIDILADVRSTVLITGESGTGKELVAEALHYHKSSYLNKPLVKVNCVTLSDNLLESELFGHVKGAFTGAISDRIGRFQRADGGTIFLDEIGDISERMQLRLLRVLQDMVFERVGDSVPIKVDVRVIAATNQSLLSKIRLGSFREDLYYRLKVIEIYVPPLRDRREDIPLLVDHFLKIFNKQFNKNITGVSDDVMKVFMDYPWPGNIRELLHQLEYACILCPQSIITTEYLPPDLTDANRADHALAGAKRNNDSQSILQTLEKAGWNKAKAARMLGIDRKTLYIKIEKFGIKEGQTSL